jgi:hypothetical protein
MMREKTASSVADMKTYDKVATIGRQVVENMSASKMLVLQIVRSEDD